MFYAFYANGGTGEPESQIKTEGDTLTLARDIPVREGYTFKGWARSASAKTAEYLPGGDFDTDANTILYAVWEADVIKGDVNGDNDVDSSDAALLLKFDAGVIDLNDTQIIAADVNGDGDADSADAALILKYDSGIIDTF